MRKKRSRISILLAVLISAGMLLQNVAWAFPVCFSSSAGQIGMVGKQALLSAYVPLETKPIYGPDAQIGATLIGATAGAAAGSFTGAGFSLQSFGTAMKTIVTKDLVSNLAYVGAVKLGESLGLDSRINMVFASAVNGLTGGIMSSGTGNNSPGKIFQSALTGFIKGTLTVGIDTVGKSLGLSPLVTGLLAAGTGSFASAIFSGDFWGTLGLGVEKLAESYFTLGNVYYDADGNLRAPTYWEQAQYQLRLQNFAQSIDQVGLLATLENYTASFMTSYGADAFYTAGAAALKQAIAAINLKKLQDQETDQNTTDPNTDPSPFDVSLGDSIVRDPITGQFGIKKFNGYDTNGTPLYDIIPLTPEQQAAVKVDITGNGSTPTESTLDTRDSKVFRDQSKVGSLWYKNNSLILKDQVIDSQGLAHDARIEYNDGFVRYYIDGVNVMAMTPTFGMAPELIIPEISAYQMTKGVMLEGASHLSDLYSNYTQLRDAVYNKVSQGFTSLLSTGADFYLDYISARNQWQIESAQITSQAAVEAASQLFKLYGNYVQFRNNVGDNIAQGITSLGLEGVDLYLDYIATRNQLQIETAAALARWDTLDGLRPEFLERRSTTVAISGASMPFEVAGIAGGVTLMTGGTLFGPATGGGSLGLVGAGAFIGIMSLAKLNDSTNHFAGAIVGNQEMMDYDTLKRWFAPNVSIVLDSTYKGISLANSFSSLSDTIKSLFTKPTTTLVKDLFKEITDVVLDGIDMYKSNTSNSGENQ